MKLIKNIRKQWRMSVKINTVQGIGDLIWVYRKLAPLHDKLDFNILIVEDSEVQKRSAEFCKCLPKVDKVTFEIVKTRDYTKVANTRCVVGETDYAVNAWLEDGFHLDDIDNNPVLWDLGLVPTPIEVPKDYLLVYISGNKSYEMTTDHWVALISRVAESKGLKNILFTGASYDLCNITKAMDKLWMYDCKLMLTPIRETFHLIKEAKYFISYQSGLCMLAEEFNTPTLMVWFPHLRKMKDSWVRKERQGLIRHCYFDEPLDKMLEAV